MKVKRFVITRLNREHTVEESTEPSLEYDKAEGVVSHGVSVQATNEELATSSLSIDTKYITFNISEEEAENMHVGSVLLLMEEEAYKLVSGSVKEERMPTNT